MTARRRLTVADGGDGVTAEADAVRFAPATRSQLGVDVGDPVHVEGSASTVATVGPDRSTLSDDAVLVGDAVGRNVAVDPGSSVTVEAVSAPVARSVTVTPADAFSLDGDADALSRVLAGRYLSVGDRVDARLFGGSLVVTLTVDDLDPSAPAEVTSDTEVSVRRDTPADAVVATPNVASADVAGLDDERATLRRLVVDPLVGDEAAADVGVRPPAGVLVHGPTGTGKTSLVRAVVGAAGLPLYEVSPDDCRRREALRSALQTAIEDAPAVLLVEDLVSAAPTPDDGGRSTPSALGWLLDRVADRAGVVLVGEATHPDDVAPALRRGGRFDAELRVGVPGRTDRREILAVHAGDARLADDVDLDALAARTHGYTGADLEALLVDAATRAVGRRGGDPIAIRSADIEAAVDAVDPATLRGVTVEQPEIAYDDIGGLAAAKREVIRAVEWPLRYPELFERLSADAPTGVLLAGPPGTGKTMLARAVADSTAANFLAVDGPELLNRYVGESERGVREVFDRARRVAPSVVFLDELDALAPERSQTDTGAAERVVSQLLTELDGLSARGEVVVLAATNRPDSIDPALLRPGRIERRVSVPLPDREDRAAVLAVHLADVPTRGVDLDAIAARTAGYSGSDLAGVVREAALLAADGYLQDREFDVGDLGDVVVRQSHLRRALERVEPSTGDNDS